MFFSHQMTNKGFIVDVQLLAILAILNIGLIDVLVIIPAYHFSLVVLILEGGIEGGLKGLQVEQGS
jgi:hypothetical protein